MAGRVVSWESWPYEELYHCSKKVDSSLSASLVVTQAHPGQAVAQCQKELSLPKVQNDQNLLVFEKMLE